MSEFQNACCVHKAKTKHWKAAVMTAYPFLGNLLGEILAGFKFCSGNAGSWNCYVLRKVPVRGFRQNQRQPLRPSVISRLTQKRLVLAEHCSCLGSATLRQKNKNLVNKVPVADLPMSWVCSASCCGRKYAIAQNLLSVSEECFSLQCGYILMQSVQTYHFPLCPGLDVQLLVTFPNFHGLW